MSHSTNALVIRETGQPFSLESITIDEIQAEEALVEICASGICHTDLSCAAGILPAPVPAVFGHEGSGVVREVGSKVTKVKPGDKVLLSYAFCNTCDQCSSGHHAYCEKILALNFGGRRTDGTSALKSSDGLEIHGHFFGQSSFAGMAVVNMSSLIKVPDETPLHVFAPLGCGLQTGAGAILNTLNVQPGSTVAVFGVGSVGLSAIMACKIRQAKVIIAVDIQPSRLELARELGATDTIDSSNCDVVEEIRKICGSNGVKSALDCSGVPKVIETMVDSLGTRGRACSVGAPSPGKRASIDVFSHLVMGREYVGCHQGESNSFEMAQYLIEQHTAGNFPFEKTITYYDIADYKRAFEDSRSGKTIKGVLLWNSSLDEVSRK